jgi:glutaredoxin 3
MNIEIYTRENCGYCTAAKELLRDRSISFSEFKLNEDFTREFLLEKFPGAQTYPVIVVDGFRIGGYTELKGMLREDASLNMKLLNERFTP